MSTVSDLVSSATQLLDRADQEAARLGNGGVSSARLSERAAITATLAVATALAASQEQAAQSAAAVAEARAVFADVDKRVAALEALMPGLQSTAASAGPKLAELTGRQQEISAGLAQIRTDLTAVAAQLPGGVV